MYTRLHWLSRSRYPAFVWFEWNADEKCSPFTAAIYAKREAEKGKKAQ